MPATGHARPLEGITVVTLEHAIAAPFCTRQLADLGAASSRSSGRASATSRAPTTIGVQGLASHFAWTNRSKESLTLDLKHAQAPAVLGKLLGQADVLVQNLAPGAAARLGLSYAALRDRHPALIVCDISGYGDDPQRLGPYRDKKAYDLLIQSGAGFLSITGTPDEPAKARCSIADIAAGMYAYSNILAALIRRGKTGLGCRIDVSMLESMVEWMSYPLYYAFAGAPPPPRAGAAHATIYSYGPFAAGDGRTVMLGLQNEREWQAFCSQVLRRPNSPPMRASTPTPSGSRTRPCCRTTSGRLRRAERGGDRRSARRRPDCQRRRQTMADVWAHPQLRARGRWVDLASPAGPLPALRPPGHAGRVRLPHGRGARTRRARRRDPRRTRLQRRGDCGAAHRGGDLMSRRQSVRAARVDARRKLRRSPEQDTP